MSFTESLEKIIKENHNRLLSNHSSWMRVELKHVASILNGFAFKSSLFTKAEGKPLIRIRDILNDNTQVNYGGEYDDLYLVKIGDLLVGMDGDFNCAIWNGPDALLNQRVCKITSNEKFYLLHFLSFVLPGYLRAINDHTSAVTVKHLSSRTISDLPLPLPPLNEQKRIVVKIEQLFSDLDAGVQTLEAIKKQIKQYRQSVLKHAFEGKLTEQWRKDNKDKIEPASKLLEKIAKEKEQKCKVGKVSKLKPVDTGNVPLFPASWEMPRLHKLCIVVTDGDHQAPPKTDKGVPFLVISNINKGILDFSNTRFVPENYYENISDSRKPVRNDILYSVTGSFGIPVIVNTDACFCFQRHIGLIRPVNLINIRYLYYTLRSSMVFNQAKYVATGTAQLTVPLNGLRNFIIPLPSLAEQAQMVLEIERRFSIADQIEKVVERALKQSRRLRQSILKRAFEGKLVLQDANDEPASVLLERIQQQRLQSNVKPKLKKTAKEKRQHSKGIYFHRGAIVSYIVNELCDNNTFGRIQLGKTVHLLQSHIGIDLEFEFKKEAAGPFDNEIVKLENIAKKSKWFITCKRKGTYGYYYMRGNRIYERCQTAVKKLGKHKRELDRLLSQFKKMNTDQVELFDTVFAVWNDFLIDGIEPSYEQIEKDFYSWSERKQKYTPDKIAKCIKWMKENDFVPTGKGKKTLVKC